MDRYSRVLPTLKPGSWKHLVSLRKGATEELFKPAGSHQGHLLNKIPPFFKGWLHFFLSLYHLSDGIIPYVTGPGDREPGTLLLSCWHLVWPGDPSFLEASQDQLHLFVTFIFLEEQNLPEELNDILSDTWTGWQFTARETIILKVKYHYYLKPWEGLQLLIFSPSQWLP